VVHGAGFRRKRVSHGSNGQLVWRNRAGQNACDTTSRLIGWVKAAMNVSDVKQRRAVQGLYPVLTCGAEFADLIRQRCAAYGQAIKRARLKTE
jgi:tripartite-type tricarboxylate transporter receptor subunit TctC